jgi:5-(carboxyamino)imidazole ribonucleotide synthase
VTLVAVVGGGQLGQMLALAGVPLGIRVRALDPDPDCPAHRAAELVVGAYDDPLSLRCLVEGADVVTFEFENVPEAAAHWIERAGKAPLRPGSMALTVGQDRLREKRFLRECGIPVAPFAVIDGEADVAKALEEIGLPAVLKTRRLGYDGKGQAVFRAGEGDPVGAIQRAWRSLGSVACVLERFIPFERELSVIGVRGVDGSVVVYPAVENTHREGMLRLSIAPAAMREGTGTISGEPHATMVGHVHRLLDALGYVGALCLEFFEAQGAVVANEFAPRVHNSGHWTIEGAVTSQFENHLRAVLGLPLGDTQARGHAAMVNLIGSAPPLSALLALPGAVHLYGKSPRRGRKVGHVTVTGRSQGEVDERRLAVERAVELAEEQASGRRGAVTSASASGGA